MLLSRLTRGDKMRATRPLASGYCIALVLIVVGQMQIQTSSCLQSQQELSRQQQPSSLLPDEQQQQQQRRRQLGINQAQTANGVGGFGEFASTSGSAADSMMGYLNSKRARKMSAFMPMRGRKDGRDYPYYASTWQQPTETAAVSYLPMRETDESDASILRLAMAANQYLGGGSTPRSFVDQMAARRAQQQQQQQQPPQAQSVQVQGGEVAFEPAMSNGLVLEPATVMQAKLRRAFHPMRGKKLDATLSDALNLAAVVDQFDQAPALANDLEM